MKNISPNFILCIILLIARNGHAHIIPALQTLAAAFALPLCILNSTVSVPTENQNTEDQKPAIETPQTVVVIPAPTPVVVSAPPTYTQPTYTMIAQHAPREIDAICNNNTLEYDSECDCRTIEKILESVYLCNRASWGSEHRCKNFEKTSHVVNLARREGKSEEEIAALLAHFKAAMVALKEKAIRDKHS